MANIPGTNIGEELNGGDEDDLITGLGGDDLLRGSGGNDTLNGGDGFDLVDYSQDGRSTGVTIDLMQGLAWEGTGTPPVGGEVDTLISIEDAVGTIHSDRFIGTASGEESFFGGLGNDTMSGGTGQTPLGFRAIDALNYHRGYSDAIASNGITATFSQTVEGSGTVTFNDGAGGINTAAGIDTFDGIERVRGTNGNDIFRGGAGFQSFRGLAGNDLFDGGADFDSVDYRRDNGSAGVIVDLAANTATDTNGNTDTLFNIEEVRGSNNNDLIKGDAQVNNLFGEGGNDVLQGGAEQDYLRGDAGRDTLEGGDGNDWLEGGLGFGDYLEGGAGDDIIFGGNGNGAPSNTNDTAAFKLPAGTLGTLSLGRTSPTTGVVKLNGVDIFEITQLSSGANAFQVKGVGLAAGLGTDTVRNIDEIHFQVPGGPVLKLQVGVSVYGAGGGNFLLQGGILNNVMDANLIFGITTSATVTARAGEGNDAVYGHEGRNNLYGEAGNDALYGKGGNDILDGNVGADNLVGGTGNDTYYVDNVKDKVVETSSGGTADKVYTTVSHTLTSYIEQLYASGSSSISLTGNSLANTIKGNAGANKVNGGLGKDALYGSTGKDTFIFNTKLSSSNVDKLADYRVADDTIHLENGIFTKLKAGKLATDAFWKGTKAADKEDRIIYDAAKGYLYYDADGTGSSKQVLFATTTKNLKMAASEFVVI